MKSHNQFYIKVLALLVEVILLASSLAACTRGGPTPVITPSNAAQTTPSPAAEKVTPSIPPSPTPTSPPLAERVNGMEITLAEYQSELAEEKAATGKEPASEDQKLVLDELRDQALLAQGAAEKGFEVDDALLQQRIQKLNDQLGGAQALKDWMASYGYTEDSFQRALRRSIAAAWMRDQIAASVPKTAEQVHARQILLYNSEQANAVLALLQAGNDFGNLAVKYDPVTGGDLGWFPRGYLPDSKLEEVAFSLQLNQYSSVIQTAAGFHILQVIERDPQRPLDPEVLLILQGRAVANWLEMHRSKSQVEVLLP